MQRHRLRDAGFTQRPDYTGTHRQRWVDTEQREHRITRGAKGSKLGPRNTDSNNMREINNKQCNSLSHRPRTRTINTNKITENSQVYNLWLHRRLPVVTSSDWMSWSIWFWRWNDMFSIKVCNHIRISQKCLYKLLEVIWSVSWDQTKQKSPLIPSHWKLYLRQ